MADLLNTREIIQDIKSMAPEKSTPEQANTVKDTLRDLADITVKTNKAFADVKRSLEAGIGIDKIRQSIENSAKTFAKKDPDIARKFKQRLTATLYKDFANAKSFVDIKKSLNVASALGVGKFDLFKGAAALKINPYAMAGTALMGAAKTTYDIFDPSRRVRTTRSLVAGGAQEAGQAYAGTGAAAELTGFRNQAISSQIGFMTKLYDITEDQLNSALGKGISVEQVESAAQAVKVLGISMEDASSIQQMFNRRFSKSAATDTTKFSSAATRNGVVIDEVTKSFQNLIRTTYGATNTVDSALSTAANIARLESRGMFKQGEADQYLNMGRGSKDIAMLVSMLGPQLGMKSFGQNPILARHRYLSMDDKERQKYDLEFLERFTSATGARGSEMQSAMSREVGSWLGLSTTGKVDPLEGFKAVLKQTDYAGMTSEALEKSAKAASMLESPTTALSKIFADMGSSVSKSNESLLLFNETIKKVNTTIREAPLFAS